MIFNTAEWLLVGAVAGVGVLHTIVPDHWVPITLIARQRGWTRTQTARAALVAGTGHVLSTLAIALVVWLAGVATAKTFGHIIDALTSLALVLFGGWIAISSLLEMRTGGGHGHSHDFEHPADAGHAHADHEHHHHDHGGGGHHHDQDAHDPKPKTSGRTALLLILGSSPMVEGIPAFFAAGRYGLSLIVTMSLVFGAATIATYVVLCVGSLAGLQRIRLGPIERYGEVLSGAFIALIGAVFWIWPVL